MSLSADNVWWLTRWIAGKNYYAHTLEDKDALLGARNEAVSLMELLADSRLKNEKLVAEAAAWKAQAATDFLARQAAEARVKELEEVMHEIDAQPHYLEPVDPHHVSSLRKRYEHILSLVTTALLQGDRS